MKTFITTRHETEPSPFASAFDPVLTGVAQGLARLFPPVQTIRQPRQGEASGPAATRRKDGAAEGGRE